MRISGTIIALALMSTGALADTQLTMVEEGMADTDSTSETIISIRNGKVAMQDSDRSLSLYDAATGEFTQVDHDEKAYIVMDAETMDQAASQMSEMMKQMESQLANLPPEQRKAMMEMMPGMAKRAGGDGERRRAEVSWTGKKDKVAGYDCRIASITDAKGDTSTACVAKPGELGMSKEDFQAVASMFETMTAMAERFNNEAPMPRIEDLDGVPIRISDSAEGTKSRLTKVSTDSLDAELFEIPAGYRKESMMGR